jgi:hypothetical protein
MDRVVLKLTYADAEQFLEYLYSQMAAWRYTERALRGEPVEGEQIARAGPEAYEARAIADYYQTRITDIERQLKRQRK